jgi:hypothetical protein
LGVPRSPPVDHAAGLQDVDLAAGARVVDGSAVDAIHCDLDFVAAPQSADYASQTVS